MKANDRRIAYCPLCGNKTCSGSLRSHVGSTRCLALVAGTGIVFTPRQQKLLDLARAFEAEIHTVRGTLGAKDAIKALKKKRDEYGVVLNGRVYPRGCLNLPDDEDEK